MSWRLLIGSHHEQRHERNANSRFTPIHAEDEGDSDEYRAVSLKISTRPCAAAIEVRDKSFLTDDSPRLPLAQCDRVCHCSFSEHPDRRRNDDRRNAGHAYIEMATHNAVSERRDNRERRRKGRFRYAGIY